MPDAKVCKVCFQPHPARVACSVWMEMSKQVPRETPAKLTLSEQKKAWWAQRKLDRAKELKDG